jgi:hypothetical protein
LLLHRAKYDISAQVIQGAFGNICSKLLINFPIGKSPSPQTSDRFARGLYMPHAGIVRERANTKMKYLRFNNILSSHAVNRECYDASMKIDKTFTATLQKSPQTGGWTYVVMEDAYEFFGTHGAVKVKGTVDGEPFQTSFMAMGDGVHMLPVKAGIRTAIKKEAGDEATVHLTERL